MPALYWRPYYRYAWLFFPGILGLGLERIDGVV
jgi:hypothetical protein